MQPAPDKLSVLSHVADLLNREVDLDILLGRMVDQVARAMDADRATLYLVDAASGEVFSKVAHLPEIQEIRLSLGQGVAGHVAASGEVVNLPSARTDARFFEGIDAETGYHTRSLLAVPIPDGPDRIIGVIQVLNKKGDGGFETGDEEFARALAAQVGVALRSTSLYARLTRPTPQTDGTGEKRGPLRYVFNNIVGESEAMLAVYDRVLRAASTDATVLVTGDSGTGKELIARAVHVNGERRDAPLVKVDCASLPPSLIENELFGHERGAYTGADRRTIGKLELADGGTVFLDEIGELPLAVQGKLLRFLQDREMERVGGTETIRTDVRVVAATNRDLAALVAAKEFRADLYYRLKVVSVHLPPLRDRGAADLEALVSHFLEVYTRRHRRSNRGLTPRAMDRLRNYPWPGNVRELENCIEGAVVLAADGPLDTEHLGLPPAAYTSRAVTDPTDPAATVETLELGPSESPGSMLVGTPVPLAEIERRHVLAVLARCDGNQSRAARVLGIGRNTLARKLKHWESK